MSLPRYPTNNDSGVEWLGEVPDGWHVQKFRHLFRESGEKIENEVVGPMLSVSGYRGIEVKEYDDENRRRSADESIGYRIVRVGQLVVNTMWLNYAGLGVSAHEGHVSPAYRSYWISPDIHSGFVHHLLRSGLYVQGYTQLLTGVRPNSLQMSRDDLMEFPVLVPERDEQAHIAAFLDRETAKIDALVAEQQRLIALLKEKRQAVISHAVTKGLNPDAPMKDSGIEWLGEVPAHWGVTRLKHASSLIVDCPHETPTLTDNGGYLTIRTPDVDQGAIFPEKMRAVDAGEYLNRIRRAPLLRNDIVYSREGERWGHAALVPEGDRFCLGQRMMQLRTSGDFVAGYLMFHLNAKSVYLQGDVETVGATSPHINVGTICNFRVAAPPFEEQAQIAAFLGRETVNLDTLTTEAQRAIDLLQERRTALISAAVTGQIDVRPAAERAAT